MIFKRSILICFVPLFLFSCGEFLKGKPKKQETIEVTKESLSCLTEVKTQFKEFLKSELDQKEIDQTFECIDKTLNEFQTRVEGKAEADAFTHEELFKIFNKYLKDSNVSQDAAKELLVLKSALLGGPQNKITKKEIEELRKYIILIRNEAKAIAPYVSLLNFEKPKTRLAKNFIEAGFGQLAVSLKNLLKSSKLKNSDYRFEDFKRLLEQLKIIEEDKKDFVLLADQLQKLLLADQSLKSDEDMNSFVDSIISVLKVYTFVLNDDVKFEIKDRQTMHSAIDFGVTLIEVLENSIQFRKTKQISIETLDPLLATLAQKDILPIKLESDTLLKFYKTLIVRVFDGGLNGQVANFTHVNQAHLRSIKREAYIYKTYMSMIDDILPEDLPKPAAGGEARLAINTLQQKAKEYSPAHLIFLRSLPADQRDLIIKAFDELRSEFLSQRPIVYRFKKVVVAANQDVWDQSWADMARAAYVKLLTRELMLGWGNAQINKLVQKSFITEPGLVQWYTDFKEFGVQTKVFDPRSENSGASNFKQANLLTYSADGDDKMSFFESVQFLNFLLSGGGQSYDELTNGFKAASCEIPATKDVFDNPWFDERCAIAELHKNFQYRFSNLSYMVTYVQKMNLDQFTKFYYEVLKVTRIDAKYEGRQIETADIRTTAILLHFIESIYARFDLDRNLNFSAAEIRAAYPVFKSFAKDYAYKNARSEIDRFNGTLAQTVGGYGCYSEDDLIRESFIFLVFTGRTPKQSDLTLVPCFRNRSLIEFKGEVDRKGIINTFKILKSVLGS